MLSVNSYSASIKIQFSKNWCSASFNWATLYILNVLFPVKNCIDVNKSTLARASSESAGSDRHVLANSGWCVEIGFPGYSSECTKACPCFHGSDVLISKALALLEHKTHTRSISCRRSQPINHRKSYIILTG